MRSFHWQRLLLEGRGETMVAVKDVERSAMTMMNMMKKKNCANEMCDVNDGDGEEASVSRVDVVAMLDEKTANEDAMHALTMTREMG